MARRNRTQGSEGAEPGTKAPSPGAESPYQQMAQSWTEFSSKLGSQMNGLMSDGSTRYTDLSTKWMKFYEEVANNMTQSMQAGNQAEIQVVSNVWKNYNTRLLNRMSKIFEDGTGAQSNLQRTWQTYVPRISEQLLRSTRGEKEEVRPDDLLKTWTDFSMRMNQDLLAVIDSTVSSTHELMDMWNLLNGEMKGLVEGASKSNQEAYGVLGKSWTEVSERMNTEIAKFVEEYTKRYSTLRESWVDWSSKMGRQLMSLSGEDGMNLEEVYRAYLERTNEFLTMFNPRVTAAESATNEELKELKKRIEQLERQVAERRTG